MKKWLSKIISTGVIIYGLLCTMASTNSVQFTHVARSGLASWTSGDTNNTAGFNFAVLSTGALVGTNIVDPLPTNLILRRITVPAFTNVVSYTNAVSAVASGLRTGPYILAVNATNALGMESDWIGLPMFLVDKPSSPFNLVVQFSVTTTSIKTNYVVTNTISQPIP